MAIIERKDVATQQTLEMYMYREFLLGLWLSTESCMHGRKLHKAGERTQTHLYVVDRTIPGTYRSPESERRTL